LLVFGKPAASLRDLLPVRGQAAEPWLEKPRRATLVRRAVPPRDHRALLPVQGRMVLQDELDKRTAGLNLGQVWPPAGPNEGAGSLQADLAPCDRSSQLPFNEAPCIDVYRWWYTFNAILARP